LARFLDKQEKHRGGRQRGDRTRRVVDRSRSKVAATREFASPPVGDGCEIQKLTRTIPPKGLRFVVEVNEQPDNTQPVEMPPAQICEQPTKALPLSDRPAIAPASGANGRTQGDRIENDPANKANGKLAYSIAALASPS
jgi:hypothetical protein